MTATVAVAAMSDELAAGVLRAAATAGRAVPRDLAVTGWDDGAGAGPLGLTTVAQSMRDQGSACARAALSARPAGQSAPWSIVHRTSTRP